MGKSDNKTVPGPADPADFVARAEPAARREEGRALMDMMARVSGCPATMWGPSIVGFGSYRYRYESGREGVAPRIGFSPRKAKISVYFPQGFSGIEALLADLGPHERTDGACLYVKRLSDVRLDVLERALAASWAESRARWPDDA